MRTILVCFIFGVEGHRLLKWDYMRTFLGKQVGTAEIKYEVIFITYILVFV